MADMITQAQFFEAHQQIMQEMQRLHVRQREHIDAKVAEVRESLDDQAKEHRMVERRVTIIETQREDEAQQAVKRSTWAGLLAAAGLTGVVELVKVWAGRS